MSNEEFEEELSKASQESVSKTKKSTRRRSRRRAAKDAAKSKSKSWMEPADSDSKEDSDYEASKQDDSESAEEMYDESDGEPSELSGDESDDGLKQVQPKPGEEGIRISAKSFGGVEEKAGDMQGGIDSTVKDANVTFGNESDGNQWMEDGSTGSTSSLDKEVEMVNLVDRVPLTPGNSVGDNTSAGFSSITGVTDPSEIFPNQEGKYLFSFTIRLVPRFWWRRLVQSSAISSLLLMSYLLPSRRLARPSRPSNTWMTHTFLLNTVISQSTALSRINGF